MRQKVFERSSKMLQNWLPPWTKPVEKNRSCELKKAQNAIGPIVS